MGLFENLFKPRPEGSVERVVEAPLKASSLLQKIAATEEGEAPDPQTAFLQPKGYAPEGTNESVSGPQGFSPVIPTGRRPPAAVRRAPLEPPPGDQIVLVLADVLPRIPSVFLRSIRAMWGR